jgi:two-component system, response regulator PdtaR
MAAARNGSILIVEDEWLLRREIVEEPVRAGWHVVEMSNARDAIDELGRQAFRVVITDIGLGGGLSGWDVGRACAAKRTPVIFVSGDRYDPSEAVPGSLFLAKPCPPAEVVRACGRWRGRELKETVPNG